MRRRRACVALLAALALSGCAGQTDTAGTDAGGAGASAATTPTPTAACPIIEGQPADDPGCAYYDPAKAMAENQRFRERIPLTPEIEASLAPIVAEMTAALQPIADGQVELTVPNVSAAIALDEIGNVPTIGQNDEGVSFIASATTGGCILGAVAVGSLSVEPVGVTMDGGCFAQSGH